MLLQNANNETFTVTKQCKQFCVGKAIHYKTGVPKHYIYE